MKKIFLLAVSILMVTLTFGQTVDPIPSYNVLVTGKANFTDNSTISTTGTQPLNYEKRDVNVSSDGGGANTSRRWRWFRIPHCCLCLHS